MIILLDTSTPVCTLIVHADKRYDYTWEAGRNLASGLLGFIESKLDDHGWVFDDIESIGVFAGPGSYTGLRIGMTVANTIADSLGVPIVAAGGSDWESDAIQKLNLGNNDRLVTPDYGGEANITRPRK